MKKLENCTRKEILHLCQLSTLWSSVTKAELRQIYELDTLFKNTNIKESLDNLYQVYLCACKICKGDTNMEESCKEYLLKTLERKLNEKN